MQPWSAGLTLRMYLSSVPRVAFSDGRQFSEQAKQFVRLNFATAPEVLEQILERSSAAVARQIS